MSNTECSGRSSDNNVRFWWDMRGIIHFELLERNQTITAELFLFATTFNRLTAIQQKKPDSRQPVLLLDDNARPHIALMTRTAVQQLGWKMLPHPAYSPDVAPGDLHLFHSLSNEMRGVEFKNGTELKKWSTEISLIQDQQNFMKEGSENLLGVERGS